MIKIGFVSQENPFCDRKAWSGTVFKLRECIESCGFEVIWIKIAPPKKLLLPLKAFLKFRYGLAMYHPWLFKLMADYTDWSSASGCDLLFFAGSAQIMNYSPLKKDYIYLSDANFNQMVDYYWANLKKRHIQLANKEENQAIMNAAFNIRASQWALDDAISYYHANPERCAVIEFGANLDEQDIVETMKYNGGKLNILFSGVDWERKGGDIAIDAIKCLREKYGIDAVLNIVGIKSLSRDIKDLDYVNDIGFLNKNNPTEYQKYTEIIKHSHLLLLPTKAECAGIVFCEASAYGLPVFTHDTGGISNYVIDGVNGYKLKIGSTGEDFAKSIYNTIENDELSKLHDSALSLYKERLNWKVWSDKFQHIVSDYLKSRYY